MISSQHIKPKKEGQEYKKNNKTPWKESYPYQIVHSNNTEKIDKYITNTVKHSRRSTKHFAFYRFLNELYYTQPDKVKKLVKTIDTWGCWKEIFMLLIVTTDKVDHNDELTGFIYEFLAEQLLKDRSDMQKKRKISRLAKWIPKQKKSLDRKLGFVSTICKVLYKNDHSNNVESKTKYMWYRKMVSSLNKHLDTTEIKICAHQLDKIDFNKVPTAAMRLHNKTFMKNDVCKQRLQAHLYKKYVQLDVKGYMDMMLYTKDMTTFDQDVMNEVWTTNQFRYVSEIKELSGVNIKNCDVVVDLSKTAYDSHEMSYIVIAAVLNQLFDINAEKKNSVVVNGYRSQKLDISDDLGADKFSIVNTINTVVQCMNDCEHINYDVDYKTLNRKTLLFISDKEDDEKQSKEMSKKHKKRIVHWRLANKKKKVVTKKKEIVAKSMLCISKTMDECRSDLSGVVMVMFLIIIAIYCYCL